MNQTASESVNLHDTAQSLAHIALNQPSAERLQTAPRGTCTTDVHRSLISLGVHERSMCDITLGVRVRAEETKLWC